MGAKWSTTLCASSSLQTGSGPRLHPPLPLESSLVPAPSHPLPSHTPRSILPRTLLTTDLTIHSPDCVFRPLLLVPKHPRMHAVLGDLTWPVQVGLTEQVLRRALELDSAVLKSISQYHDAQELPSSVFTRLMYDLKPLLAEGAPVQGRVPLRLGLPQLRQVVRERCLHPLEKAEEESLHRILARVLLVEVNAPAHLHQLPRHAPAEEAKGSEPQVEGEGQTEEGQAEGQTEGQAESREGKDGGEEGEGAQPQGTPAKGNTEGKEEEKEKEDEEDEEEAEGSLLPAPREDFSGGSEAMLELLVDSLAGSREWFVLEAVLVDLRFLARRFHPAAIHRDLARGYLAAKEDGQVLRHVEQLGHFLSGNPKNFVHTLFPWEALPDWFALGPASLVINSDCM